MVNLDSFTRDSLSGQDCGKAWQLPQFGKWDSQGQIASLAKGDFVHPPLCHGACCQLCAGQGPVQLHAIPSSHPPHIQPQLKHQPQLEIWTVWLPAFQSSWAMGNDAEFSTRQSQSAQQSHQCPEREKGAIKHTACVLPEGCHREMLQAAAQKQQQLQRKEPLHRVPFPRAHLSHTCKTIGDSFPALLLINSPASSVSLC